MLLYKFLCSDLINMSILCIMLKKYCAILLSLPSWECGLKYQFFQNLFHCHYVTPFVGVWIEIGIVEHKSVSTCVTPFVGVWIEIGKTPTSHSISGVTPFVGVWIEICYRSIIGLLQQLSLPSWECGLKYIETVTNDDETVTPFVGVWIEIKRLHRGFPMQSVTPFVGVWIEIKNITGAWKYSICHSLRGSVD